MTTPRLKPPAQLAGRFLVSGDPGWDEARLAWNLAVDQRPLAVTYPEAVEDVVAVVELARSEDLRVAVQCTGHNAAPVGSLERAILLKPERMRQVEIDPVAGTALCEAGVLWPEVGRAAAEHDLAPLAGTSPDVGVVGYTIGGGVSWLGRKHGLAANSVLAVELVTVGGDFVRADRDNEPDLFWGRAWRRRLVRDRDGARVRPVPGRGALRGGPVLTDRASRRDTCRVARVGRGGARRGHLHQPAAAVPADP
jgi:FAD/FMN-containing dehydrogenase